MDTNFSERERELMQMRQQRMAEAAGQTTQPAQQAAPAQPSGTSSRAFIPSTQVSIPGGSDQPSAKQPDVQQIKESIGNAAPGMLQNMLLPALTAAGLTGLGYLLLKEKGGGGGGGPNPPDDNNPPNNTMKSREIRREPMMDVSRKGPLEPTFNPEQPLDLTKPLPISSEQAAAHIAEMPEHPNPITKIEPSTLSQVGSSETAKITKEVTEQQKKIKGKAGGAVEPKSLTEHIAKATAIEPFKRNESGAIQWPEKMSPAARAGAEQFATQFPDVAKELEAKGKFGILGAGSGDNNLYNSYGSDMMKTLRNEVNQGQMVGDYFNYKNKVNPAVMAISPETPLGKQLEDLRVNQPKGGVHGQLGQPVAMKEGKLLVDANKLNKTLKAGGAAALLMSITNAANAKEAARNVGEAILPWGMTPSEVESGKLTEKQLKAFEEAKKLGSPYRAVPPPTR